MEAELAAAEARKAKEAEEALALMAQTTASQAQTAASEFDRASNTLSARNAECQGLKTRLENLARELEKQEDKVYALSSVKQERDELSQEVEALRSQVGQCAHASCCHAPGSLGSEH